MCDYSLEGFASRKAEVGDKLVVSRITGHGFMREQDDAKLHAIRPTAADICMTCLFEDGIVLEITRTSGRIQQMTYVRLGGTAHDYRDYLKIDGCSPLAIASLPTGTKATVLSIPSQPTLEQKLGVDKLNANITQDKDPAGVPKTTDAPAGVIGRIVEAISRF